MLLREAVSRGGEVLLRYVNRGDLPDRCSGSDGNLYERSRSGQAAGECSDSMKVSRPARKIVIDNRGRLRYLNGASVRSSHVFISWVMAAAGTSRRLTFSPQPLRKRWLPLVKGAGAGPLVERSFNQTGRREVP